MNFSFNQRGWAVVACVGPWFVKLHLPVAEIG